MNGRASPTSCGSSSPENTVLSPLPARNPATVRTASWFREQEAQSVEHTIPPMRRRGSDFLLFSMTLIYATGARRDTGELPAEPPVLTFRQNAPRFEPAMG